MTSQTRLEELADDEAKAVFNERLLTIKRVALLFGVKVTTIREWIARGDLMAIRIGKEYRISETALREYKKEREEQARKELQEKRRKQEFEARLTKHQANEPNLKWAVTTCTACGLEPVLSTRHDRLDGRVYCDWCTELAKREDWLPSKDGWERKIALQVDELNWQAEESLGAYGQLEKEQAVSERRRVQPFLVYHCPFCGKPKELARDDLKNPLFYPRCDHMQPFAVYPRLKDEFERGLSDYHEAVLAGIPIMDSAVQALTYHPRVVAHLAEVEARERDREEGLDDPDLDGTLWNFCTCAHCGRRLAVAKREDRLVGNTQCRMCVRTRQPACGRYRMQIILEVLRETHGDSFRLTSCPNDVCDGGCHLWDDSPGDDQGGPLLLLSRCRRESAGWRQSHVNEYISLLNEYLGLLSLSPDDERSDYLWSWVGAEPELEEDLPS